jgi:hypothetical protein
VSQPRRGVFPIVVAPFTQAYELDEASHVTGCGPNISGGFIPEQA